MKNWKVEREVGNVAVLTLDRPDKDVNTLAGAVLRELADIVAGFADDPSLEGVVIISGKKDFVLGADINEIASLKTVEAATDGSRQMQAVFQKLADLKVPTVAAIHGQCLGGGLEMALACTWRVVTNDPRTKLALPEIQLGLIPGAGGTQRLPRLIGLQGALDMILTGKRLSGKKAEKIGLADACVPMQLLREQGVLFATKKRQGQRRLPDFKPGKLTQDLPKWATEGNPIGRKLVQKKVREMVDEKTKGFYPASYKAIEAVFDGYDLPLPKALELESILFGQLSATREAKSLIHLFHATTSVKKHAYKAAGKEKFGDTQAELIGVIGAGFMGGGITNICAEKGLRVRLSDPNRDSISRALKHSRGYFQKKVDRKRMKQFEATKTMAHISPGLTPQGFGQCDVVIEAVFEDLALKQKILKQIEEMSGDEYIFATNTSAIPVTRIAEAAKRPEHVIGMHFFSPVEKMPLLEVVVTARTADWVAARVVDLGQAIGKQVIVVKDGPGFYTTRALAFFLAEASHILLGGTPIETIDKALTDFGFPVGPITLIDEVGIDVGMHVLDTIQKAFPDRMTAPEGLKPVAASGRLGRKNNKGFYTYENGKKGRPDAQIYMLLGLGKNGDKTTAEEIVDRCMLVFVNESVRCLEEGILASAYDGDVGAVFGLGFPPFWGGPFRYVDHVGAAAVVGRLKQLAEKYGARFAPAQTLVDHAKTQKLFFPDEA
jgi:3-hydroxyacyl-CoA dehydrogenase/enoyl-CoA hydratase/3-hydroxybutyryl-CoA epimerase